MLAVICDALFSCVSRTKLGCNFGTMQSDESFARFGQSGSESLPVSHGGGAGVGVGVAAGECGAGAGSWAGTGAGLGKQKPQAIGHSTRNSCKEKGKSSQHECCQYKEHVDFEMRERVFQ